MNRYIIYQAFGPQYFLHELVFSVYSLIDVYGGKPNCQVVVYTDNLAWLKDKLPEWVIMYPLPRATVEYWSGPQNFTHRVKLKTLLDFMEHHHGQIIFADTDTRFLAKPDYLFDKIEAGSAVLHNREGQVNQRNTLGLYKLDNFLRKNPDLGISHLMTLFNDGIIGLQSHNYPIVDQVLALCDRIFKTWPDPLVEQLAFSWMLGRNFDIVSAGNEVYHYWNFKEFREVLKQFFTFYQGMPWQLVASKIHQIEPVILHKPKLEFESKSVFTRALKTFSKEPWKMPAYKFS